MGIDGFYGMFIDTDTAKRHYYETLKRRMYNSNYGIVFENYYNLLLDLIPRVYNWKNTEELKEKLNSIYGTKIFNKKENKTMTNFEWIANNPDRTKEFIDDIENKTIDNFYAKYGIEDKYKGMSADVFAWLIKSRVPPKTECYDLYKLIKFVSNPALFSSEETTDILFYIVKLDNFRYHKGYGEYSVAIKKDNAIDIIFNGKLRANRKSLVTERLNLLPVIKLDLTDTARSV